MKTFLLYITLCITINADIGYYSFPAVPDEYSKDSIKFTFNYKADQVTVGCNYNPSANSTTYSSEIYLNLQSEQMAICYNQQYLIGLSSITTVKEIEIYVYSSKDGSFITSSRYSNSYFENTQVSLVNNQFYVGYNASIDFIIQDNNSANQKIFVEILRCSLSGIYVKKYSTDTYFNYLQSIDGYGVNHYDYLEGEKGSIYQKYSVDDYSANYNDMPVFLIKVFQFIYSFQYQRYNADKDFSVNDYNFPSYISSYQKNNQLLVQFQPVSTRKSFNYIEYIVSLARYDERPNLACMQGTSNYNYYENYTQQVIYDYTNSNNYESKEIAFYDPNPAFDYITLTVILHLNNGVKIQREISGTYFYFYNRHDTEILQLALLPVWISLISLATITFSAIKYKLKMRKQNNKSIQAGAVPGF